MPRVTPSGGFGRKKLLRSEVESSGPYISGLIKSLPSKTMSEIVMPASCIVCASYTGVLVRDDSWRFNYSCIQTTIYWENVREIINNPYNLHVTYITYALSLSWKQQHHKHSFTNRNSHRYTLLT